MTKFFFTGIFALFTSGLYSQSGLAMMTSEAAEKALRKKEYKKADSLFTRSIELDPKKSTYYKRAEGREKAGDKLGFCEDLAAASELQHKEARRSFMKQCGSLDTVYLTKTNLASDKAAAQKIVIRYHINAFDKEIKFLYDKYYLPVNADSFVDIDTNEVVKNPDQEPEFPGGILAMYKHISRTIMYPSAAREAGISGKVILRFVITKNGTVKNVEVIHGMHDCFECDQEAVRVIRTLPAWKPGLKSGKPVHTYFTCPINYKIS
jgi:TonB family protein